MTKPLLLLDVDGVLNALGSGSGKMTMDNVNGFPIHYSVHTHARLHKLSKVFQLVWATAWENDANKYLSPLWLLDDLPTIRFPLRHDEGPTWKLHAVRAFVRDKPCAWIDDDIHEDAHQWARARKFPTMLLEIDPVTGLTPRHMVALVSWGSSLSKSNLR